MNWFRQNRFLGIFLIVLGVAKIASLYFVFGAKSSFGEAKVRFDENAAELNRLQRLAPYPNEANLRKMKTQAEEYAAGLEKLKEELKTRVLPVVPLAPNEFQARLRQAVTTLTEKAQANHVKLPENFFLGFEEFSAALPDTAAAPGLGQQLAQAELLMNILLEARVESVTSFRRVPSTGAILVPARPTPPVARRPGPSPTPSAPTIERALVETSFVATPGAARRVLNQISAAPEQLYVIRTLYVLNEKDKGPPREETATESNPPSASPAGSPGNAALNFIVGTEKVQTTARIEMLRFAF